jgi:hypothetical protein
VRICSRPRPNYPSRASPICSGPYSRSSTDFPGRRLARSRGRWRSGPPIPGDRFAVAAATLGILAAGAEEGPLLVAVDDAHWLDAPSREALLFAARRLGQEGIVIVLASRGHQWLADAGIDRLELTGLAADEAQALIDLSKRPVSPNVRERLIADTAGNPSRSWRLSTGSATPSSTERSSSPARFRSAARWGIPGAAPGRSSARARTQRVFVMPRSWATRRPSTRIAGSGSSPTASSNR